MAMLTVSPFTEKLPRSRFMSFLTYNEATGWLALSLLIFPIIYVAPYMSMTFAAASVKLIKDHCDENDSSKNTSAKPEIYGKAAEAEDNVLV